MWQWKPWKRGLAYQGLDVLAKTGLWSWLTSCLLLSSILSGFFLVKHHQQPWPQLPHGVSAAQQAVWLSSRRELQELGTDRGVQGVDSSGWRGVRRLTGTWRAQGLLSAGGPTLSCLHSPGHRRKRRPARCQQIIVILLPRLNQRVIKSGSMLPWDFFFFFLVGTIR